MQEEQLPICSTEGCPNIAVCEDAHGNAYCEACGLINQVECPENWGSLFEEDE